MSFELFGTPDEFFGMLERVKAQCEREEKEFFDAHPDGIDIEYTDGSTVHVEGPNRDC